MSAPRILPLQPPYEPDVELALSKWMPAGSGVPPLALFRTLARHPMLREVLRPVGAGLRSRGKLSARVRELLILRTCARCDAQYEWEVHVAAFAAAAGLDDAVVQSTVTADPVSLSERTDIDGLILRVADEFHGASTISDTLYGLVFEHFDEEALLEMAAVCGFYHLISFVVRVARVEREPWAPSFPKGTP